MSSKIIAFLLFCLLVAIYFFDSYSPSQKNNYQPPIATSTSTNSETSALPSSNNTIFKRISGEDYIGCISKKYYSKLVEFAVSNDNAAFKKALSAGIATGICTILKEGEKVYVTDTSIFSGMVKVRREGGLKEYWTAIEAIQGG